MAVFAACQKTTTDQVGHDDIVQDGQMRFEMSVGNPTKTAASDFKSGDKVGVFVVEYTGETANPLQISGNWANNVAVAYDGINWEAAKTIYWPENKVDVYGYYPYMNLMSVDEQHFSVALDQSTARSADVLGGYESSDLLWAKAAEVAYSEESPSVSLAYKHIMSKLVVKLVKGPKYSGVLPEVSELYIHNVVPDAIVNLTNGSVVKDMYGKEATIKANRIDDETFEAIIVPQRLESSRPLIEIISNGVSYLLESSFYFRNGKQHTLNLTINGNPDQISIEIGGQIDGWIEQSE